MKIYTKHSPPPSPGIDCSGEPSLTQQHFQKECDVTEMLRKFGATGELPEKQGSFYGDFSNGFDFQQAHDALLSTMEQFNSLPSACRDRFGNNPAAFLDFVSNPDNVSQFASLGLTEAVVPVIPLDVTGTTDTIATTNEVPK